MRRGRLGLVCHLQGAGYKETIRFLLVRGLPVALSTSAGCGMGTGSELEPCKTILNTQQWQGSISSVLETCLWANEALTGLVICFECNKT